MEKFINSLQMSVLKILKKPMSFLREKDSIRRVKKVSAWIRENGVLTKKWSAYSSPLI